MICFLIRFSLSLSETRPSSPGIVVSASCGPSSPCVFSYNAQSNDYSYVVPYDLMTGDQIKFRSGGTAVPSSWSDSTFTQVDDLNRIFLSASTNTKIWVMIQPATSKTIYARCGITYNNMFCYGTVVTTESSFDTNVVRPKVGKGFADYLCVLFVQKSATGSYLYDFGGNQVYITDSTKTNYNPGTGETVQLQVGSKDCFF